MTIGTIFSVSIYAQQDYDIPDWVKNTAGWWADDQIDDASFVNGIKFLIENDVMEIETENTTTYYEYPDNGDFYLTYEPNPNSPYTGEDTAIAWLKNSELLEYEIEFLNENFRLPYDVEIIAMECNEINAFYDYETKQVIICYEFVDDVFDTYYYFYGEDEDFDIDLWGEYGYDVIDFVFWHEIGHALIDIYDLPILGLEEDVADQLSVYMMMTKSSVFSTHLDARVFNAMQWWKDLDTGVYSDSTFADTHSLSIQRYYKSRY